MSLLTGEKNHELNQFHNFLTCNLGYKNDLVLLECQKLIEESPNFLLPEIIIAQVKKEISILQEIISIHIDTELDSNTSYSLGYLLYSQNDVRCVPYLQKSSDAGCIPALYLLGKLYFDGFFVHQDTSRAWQYFELADKSDNILAAFEMAVILYKNQFKRSQSSPLFWKAAQSGYPKAWNYCFKLEHLECNRDVTWVLTLKSWKDFIVSRDLGDVDCMSTFGQLTFLGFFRIPSSELPFCERRHFLERVASMDTPLAKQAQLDCVVFTLASYPKTKCDCKTNQCQYPLNVDTMRQYLAKLSFSSRNPSLLYNWIYFVKLRGDNGFDLMQNENQDVYANVNMFGFKLCVVLREKSLDQKVFENSQRFRSTFSVNSALKRLRGDLKSAVDSPFYDLISEVKHTVKQNEYIVKDGVGRKSEIPFLSNKLLNVGFSFEFIGKSKMELMNDFFEMSLWKDYDAIIAASNRYLKQYPNDVYFTHVIKEMKWRKDSNLMHLCVDKEIVPNSIEDEYQIMRCKYFYNQCAEKCHKEIPSDKLASFQPFQMLMRGSEMKIDELLGYADQGYLEAIYTVGFQLLHLEDSKSIEICSKFNFAITHLISGLFHHFISKDYKASLQSFYRSASLGCPLAQIMVGLINFSGFEQEINDEEAMFYLTKAIVSSDPQITKSLTVTYTTCKKLVSTSNFMHLGVGYREAFTQAWSKYIKGDIEATYEVARSYLDAKGVEENKPEGYRMMLDLLSRQYWKSLLYLSNYSENKSDRKMYLNMYLEKGLDFAKIIEIAKYTFSESECHDYISKFFIQSGIETYSDIPDPLKWDTVTFKVLLKLKPELIKSMTSMNISLHKEAIDELGLLKSSRDETKSGLELSSTVDRLFPQESTFSFGDQSTRFQLDSFIFNQQSENLFESSGQSPKMTFKWNLTGDASVETKNLKDTFQNLWDQSK